MGDHYIPRYYLRGFCSLEQPNLITRLAKSTGDVLATDLKNVAQENDFYSKDIEEYLSNEIEGPANGVLERLRGQNRLGSTEKPIFARYLTALLKRVPRGLERYREMAPGIYERLFSETEQQISEIETEKPEMADLMQRRRQELAALRREYENGPPKEVWLNHLHAENSLNIESRLASMTWTFLVAREGAEYITGDNPVFFHTDIGIGHARSEVTFPISSKIALWATWAKTLPEDFVQVRKSVVKLVNRRTASSATKYIFATGDYAWARELAKTEASYRHRSIML